MKSAGVPKCEIKNITGHSSEKGLDAYDSGNEEEMYQLSNVIAQSTSTSCSSKENSVNRNRFSFGVIGIII